jgi:hypothetical protein
MDHVRWTGGGKFSHQSGKESNYIAVVMNTRFNLQIYARKAKAKSYRKDIKSDPKKNASIKHRKISPQIPPNPISMRHFIIVREKARASKEDLK